MSMKTSPSLTELTVPSMRLPFLNLDSCPACASISAIAADFSPLGVGFLIAINLLFYLVFFFFRFSAASAPSLGTEAGSISKKPLFGNGKTPIFRRKGQNPVILDEPLPQKPPGSALSPRSKRRGACRG